MLAFRFAISLILFIVPFASAKVASLDLGADQWVLGLCDKKDIFAVTYLASSKDLSYLSERAKGVRTHKGHIETFLSGDVKIVVAYRPISPFYLKVFKRKGIQTILLDAPKSLSDLKKQTSYVAKKLGAEEKSASLIKQINRIYGKENESALFYGSHGLCPGTKTFMSDLLENLGFQPPRFKGWRYLSKECILKLNPKYIFFLGPIPSGPFWKALNRKTCFQKVPSRLTLTTYPEAVSELAEIIMMRKTCA